MTRFHALAPTALSLSIGLLCTVPAQVRADLASLPRLPDPSRLVPTPHLPAPPVEPDHAGATLASPFGGKVAGPNVTGQTLAAPVTVNATTSTDAMTVTQSGTGRAINGVINNSKSTLTALKGATNGSGAALGGLNSGTTGPAGQFQVTNASSSQPGLIVTTSGTGNALQAIVSTTTNDDSPAIVAQHNAVAGVGYGVEGDGGYAGIQGNGYIGVRGDSESFGVYGKSGKGIGVIGVSDSSYAGEFFGPVYVTGAMTAQSYASSSDRNVKQDITAVDTVGVLDRIAAMPIASWDFKAQPGIHHIGPMAQDFRAAFGLGVDDKHIDVVDGIGVSLAAIQELQRQLKEKEARIAALEGQAAATAAAVDARFAALEQSAALTAAARTTTGDR